MNIFRKAGLLICFLAGFTQTWAQLSITPFVSNVFKVTDIAHAGDDRLFIVEQAGRIRISDLDGNLNPVPFLSITNRVLDSGGEQGLLGLAFSPNFNTDRCFYVNYTNNSGNTVISRFRRSFSDNNVADSLNEEILFTVNQPYTNHNGGAMHFGPDGYLYISLGDGGAGGDPQNNAQNLQSRLGKLLRIDVSIIPGYKIPVSNPFINTAGADSMIWAYGLRNAWRFSFDRQTGDNWIADVGQNLWEEINVQPNTSTGGENYGWRCYEGFVSYNLTGCLPPASFVEPVYAYSHSGACSVTGGYVYRGAKYANWFGNYFFTDYCSGIIQSLNPNDTGGYDLQNYGAFGAFVYTTFGEDKYGELYIGKGSSGVFKLIDSTCTPVAYIGDRDTIRTPEISYVLKTPQSPDLTYQWLLNGNVIPFAKNYLYQAKLSGNYEVVVSNDSNCTNRSQPLTLILEIDETFVVYPNPANEYTEIKWSLNFPGNKTLELIDATGRICKSVSLDANASGYTLFTKHFNQGVYLVRIIYNDKYYTTKLLIK